MPQDAPVIAVTLREVRDEDLPVFFAQQADPVSVHMAGVPARDHESFAKHWVRIRNDESIILRTILADGVVVGHLVVFGPVGNRQIGYWLEKVYWGQDIATHALRLFLNLVTERPLYAHVVHHNLGSQRVLEKNGFLPSDDLPDNGDKDPETARFCLR